MLSPLAVSLAAFHSLVATGASPARDAARSEVQEAFPPQVEMIIARPEASDLYVGRRTRTSATSLLTRNPQLIRAGQEESAYDLTRATNIGWDLFRHSDLPAAHAWHAVQGVVIPEAGTSLLLVLGSLLFLRRRRTSPFDLGFPVQFREATSRSSGFKSKSPSLTG